MSLNGKRIVVLAEDMYEDPELWYPYYRLLEEGAEVILVGPEAKTYESKHGYPAKAERAAADVRVEDVDAVVVPGGFAPDRLRRSPAVLDLVRGVSERGGGGGMICPPAGVALWGGIVKGNRATCVSAIKDDLINAGATYVDEAVVVDGNLISSRTPADLPAFMPAIIAALA